MLAEWISYLTTPCDGHLKRMGYLREAVSLASRAARCQAAWASHHEACRHVVADAMQACPTKGRAVVLGAGLLEDIPLDAMAETFDDVVLIDAVFLRAARRQAARHRNVRVVTEDVTGVLDNVQPGQPLPTPRVHGPAVAEGADFVASVGLASQLPLLPVDYAGRPDAESQAFSHALIQAHLDWLASLAATVCVITDVERQTWRDGTCVAREDALAGVGVPTLAREWLWDIAPRPEALDDADLRFVVRGGVLS